MLQLVKKDFYIHKMIWFLMILGMGTYIFLQAPPLFIGIIFCITMTNQLFAIDEKKETQLLLNSLPFTRKEIVSSKYVTAFLYILSIIATISVFHILVHQKLPDHAQLLVMAIVGLAIVSICYPFAYRFSTKYFNFLYGGIIAVYFICLKLFIPNLHDQIRYISSQLLTEKYIVLYMCLLFATLLLYGLSWLLSIRIYSKKVFE